jgi:hypothetical protein
LLSTGVPIRMSSLSWPSFLKNFPSGHLVVAVAVDVGADEIGSRRLRDLRDLLRQFVGGLPLSGAFALTVSRAAGFPEILCAFEIEADARLLAKPVCAEPAAGYPGFASQRVFSLDTPLEAALRAERSGKRDMDQR